MSVGAFSSTARFQRAVVGRLRRYFAGPMFGNGARASRPSRPSGTASRDGEGVFARQERQFTTAQIIIRCFYAFTLYYAVTQCTEFTNLSYRMHFTPLWPVEWISVFPGPRNLSIVALAAFYALACVAGAFFASHRAARGLVFVGMLEYFAFRNSFGKIGHSTHLFVMTALLLVFLPADWHRPAALAPRRARQETLIIFWLCQAAILMSYTMSGIGKLCCALYQIAAGQPSAFSPGALGAHVALRLVQTHSHSVLGSLIIDHPYLTWPLMPVPIYIELFAFWIAFRPALGRWWALALILFHMGTIFTLTITFPVACLLLALFFFQSPFQPTNVRWREVFASTPLVCELLILPSIIQRRNEARKAKRILRDRSTSILPVS